jgi:hypothetical protein
MPCKEYENLKALREMEMGTWAQYTYSQNKRLRGGVSDRKAKQIAQEARANASEIGKQIKGTGRRAKYANARQRWACKSHTISQRSCGIISARDGHLTRSSF